MPSNSDNDNNIKTEALSDIQIAEPKVSSTNRFTQFFKKDTPSDEPSDNSQPISTVDSGLKPSRNKLLTKLNDVFKTSISLDDDVFDMLEEALITSDVGVETSVELIEKLRLIVKKEKIDEPSGVINALRGEISKVLLSAEKPWSTDSHKRPKVILVVGVNGVGKTTSSAKIANLLKNEGNTVVLAAADTFRAAAVEQLQHWGAKLDMPVIAQQHGADSAAVAHDAYTSAVARDADVLIIDTAGRLHSQNDLMQQLQKLTRVITKLDHSAPHEVILILDANTGQNAISQLEHFQQCVNVTSLCLTKLDGSAKGGMAISLTSKFKLPIRFIGIGEGIQDLLPFNAIDFSNALIPEHN